MFWGDPHFKTLDGKTFIFNGLGEYTLLKLRAENVSFDLQARTERAMKSDGTLSDATIFSAFAAKDGVSSLHVELNASKDGKYLQYIDGTTDIVFYYFCCLLNNILVRVFHKICK